MRNGNDTDRKERNIDTTLNALSARKEAPKIWFFVLLIIYIFTSVVINRLAHSNNIIRVGNQVLPFTAFAGVLSSLGNLSIISLVVVYRKKGFYTALIILLSQFPLLLIQMMRHHNIAILPGIFGNILTSFAVLMLYLYNVKIEKYQIRLRDQAVTDRLTGLPNRFACSELINDLVSRNEKFAVVSIDLNNFKSINDTMGHDMGNVVLTEIAKRWKAAADSRLSGTLDFITRQGGDEFAIIIRNYHSDEDIENTIRYYESVLENRLTINECDYFITASFGYAEYPTDAQNVDSLFSYADAAMYNVKRTNNSEHLTRFTPDLLNVEKTLEIERKIRTALEEDRIYFVLQPQYDISHKLRGFEALARMDDPDGGNISPVEFIPVAEKVGLIDKVDLRVLRKAADFFSRIIKKSDDDITLSVNVSVKHLMKNDFIDEIKDVINSFGIPGSQLEIEITESVMIDSAEKALQCINDIKSLGVKIAIDDFGTGYSSLSYLNKFPADLLKIDKSFIDKMNTSESSKQYVAAIISIGHIMDFEVISEGVEDDQQLEILRDIGCDFIQGYIWGRPLPQEEAELLVLGGSS